MADGVRGRSRVAVEREGATEPQYHVSPWFGFKSPVEEETRETDGSSVPPEEQGRLKEQLYSWICLFIHLDWWFLSVF